MINALNPGRNPDISLVFPDVNLQRIAAHCKTVAHESGQKVYVNST